MDQHGSNKRARAHHGYSARSSFQPRAKHWKRVCAQSAASDSRDALDAMMSHRRIPRGIMTGMVT